ncbi:MAG: O-methyltransferase [candidate division NC10 bacterium]|nr:O-methyltransferase [candidate division NC10 bacterium]
MSGQGRPEGGLTLLPASVEAYLQALPAPADPLFAELEARAAERGFPIVGPLVGRLLELCARLVQAHRILELGSGFGYSALWLARGLERDGTLLCVDVSPENAALAGEAFRRAGIADKVRFEVDDALALLDRTSGLFDLIFNDIDKEQYPAAFPKILPRLRRGGLLLTDNLLWQGRVATEEPAAASTRAVREYTRLLYASPELLTIIVPLRDGVGVSLRR